MRAPVERETAVQQGETRLRADVQQARDLLRLAPSALLAEVAEPESFVAREIRRTARVAAWRYGGRRDLPGRYRDLCPDELSAELAADTLVHLFSPAERASSGELRIYALLRTYTERPTGRLAGWVSGVARRTVQGLMRHELRREAKRLSGGEGPVLEELPAEADPPWTSAAVAHVERTLEELVADGLLSREDADLYLRVTCARALGYTLREVCKDLAGCSPGSLANRVGRIAKRLFAGLAARLTIHHDGSDLAGPRSALPQFLEDEALDLDEAEAVLRLRAARGARWAGPDEPSDDPLVFAVWCEAWRCASWPAARELAPAGLACAPWVGRLGSARLLAHLNMPTAGRAREAVYQDQRRRIHARLEALP